MKYLRVLFVLSLIFNVKAFACDLSNAIRHTNPDGSEGGLVSRTAKVAPTVFLGTEARICDKAWVDGNAKILDQAIVKEEAWVREYSIIKDRAIVSGKAYIMGTRNTPVLVTEDSRVYGEAKVLTGTKISGRAEIFGGVSLKDSIISGMAKVCESYIISNQEIIDDYFCLETDIESRITIFPFNVEENKFNRRPRSILFKSTGLNFSRDQNIYIVLVNRVQVDPNDVFANGSILRIEDLTSLVEGVNEVTISGRDEYGKKISQKTYSIFIGSNSKTINLNPSPSTPLKFEVNYELNGERYTGDFRIGDGQLILEGLPNDVTDLAILIKGVGSEGFIAESYEGIDQLPNEIQLTSFPGFKNNVLDFSEGISDWEISHPENVTLSENENGRFLSISAHETEVVELAKTVHLSDINKALSINFSLPSSLLFRSFNKSLQVILVNRDEKTIIFNEYSPLTFSKSKSSEGLINLQLGKKYNGKTMSVFYRLLPVLQTKSIAQDTVNVFEGSILNKFIDFKVRNLAIKNKQSNHLFPSTSGDNVSCTSSSFELKSSQFDFKHGELNSFSAGSLFNMPLIAGNRIFGSLDILRGDDSKIKKIELIGEQNGVVKFETPLANCANKIIGEDRKVDVHLPFSINIIKFLFEVPVHDLSNVDTSPGAQISLKVKVTFEDDRGNTFPSYSSSTKPLVVLKAPILGEGFNYSGNDRFSSNHPDFNADGVDNYDSPTRNYNRTGGDKWIKPAYADTFTAILNSFAQGPSLPKWQVNDMGRLNGGPFLGHTEHHSGLDADIQFKEYNSGGNEIIFNFADLGNDPIKWKSVLNELDEFLSGINEHYKNIRNIYVSRNFNQNSSHYLNNRFENRCYNGRYIHFDSRWGAGTLLRDVVGHHNHFHLSFLPTDGNEQKQEIDMSVSDLNNLDLDDFYYSLNSDATILTVEPIKPEEFENGIKVFWRYQDTEDFSDTDMAATFGMWPPPSAKKNKLQYRIKFNDESSIRYIYLAIAKENGVPLSLGAPDQNQIRRYKNGACLERSVAIDLGTKIKSRRWKFKKVGNNFVMEHL